MRFVDRLAGKAEVGDGGNVPLGNVCSMLVGAASARPSHLAPLLRGIVLVREPAFGLRLDLQGIGLGPVGRRYQFIVCALRLGEACSGLGGVVNEGSRITGV